MYRREFKFFDMYMPAISLFFLKKKLIIIMPIFQIMTKNITKHMKIIFIKLEIIVVCN